MGKKLKVLDLFSGIGGFSKALEELGGFETVAFCEIDPFCQEILRKHWKDVPIYDDVRTIDFKGEVDVICGGFPCQPYSVAGSQKGKDDERDLWKEMFTCIKRYKPTWVIGENVPGIVNMALDNVLTDLESLSYSTQTLDIPACAIGAKHIRRRVWILGYSEHDGLPTTERSGRVYESQVSPEQITLW